MLVIKADLIPYGKLLYFLYSGLVEQHIHIPFFVVHWEAAMTASFP